MKEMVAQQIHDRTTKIKNHLKMGSQHYLEAGLYIKEALDAKDHWELGCKSEEEYFADYLGLKPSTAYNLKGIAADFFCYLMEDERLIGCDYTRLVQLRPVVKDKQPEEIREWLHKALTHSSSDFNTAIRVAKGSIEPEDCGHEDTYTVTVCRTCGYRRRDA